MIVVDIGCYHHPSHRGASQDSMSVLIERFKPRILFGFDPHPLLAEGHWQPAEPTDAEICLTRAAAWTFQGMIPFHPMRDTPLSAHVGAGDGSIPVPCFDLAAFITALPLENEEVVLKLDAEGAEYVLLPRLIDRGLDEFFELLLVEWHDLPSRAADRDRILASLRCPVEVWG